MREFFPVRSPQTLFRNIQVINWHKYKESTNKNGYPIRRMVLAEQEARIFFVINKVLPNFRRNFLWHDSLRNGRHGGVQLIQQTDAQRPREPGGPGGPEGQRANHHQLMFFLENLNWRKKSF